MTEPRKASENVTVKSRNRRDAQLLDLDEKTLDPSRHYRWVRCRADEHLQSVTKHKLRGYTLETTEGGVKTIAEADKRPDGVIAIGDVVLMSCPKGEHEQQVRARQAHTEQLLASTSATTKEMAKEKGIKLIEDE